jgi:hypothetical protein
MKTNLLRASARALLLGTAALIVLTATDQQARADCGFLNLGCAADAVGSFVNGVGQNIQNGVTTVGKELHIIPDTPPASPIPPSEQNAILAPSSAPPISDSLSAKLKNAQQADDLVAAATKNINDLAITHVITASEAAAAVAQLVGPSGGTLIPPGATQLVTAGANGASVISNDGGSMLAFAALVTSAGGKLIAQGGGNLIAQGGGNLIAQGGGNLIAQGGGNLTAALITNDGGSLVQKASAVQTTMIQAFQDGKIIDAAGAAALKQIVANGGNIVSTNGGTLVGNDGSSLVAAGAGNFSLSSAAKTALIAQGGGNIVSTNGGTLISQDGGGAVAAANSLLQGSNGAAFVASAAGIASGRGLLDAGQNKDAPLVAMINASQSAPPAGFVPAASALKAVAPTPLSLAQDAANSAKQNLTNATNHENDLTTQLAAATKKNDNESIALLKGQLATAKQAVTDAQTTFSGQAANLQKLETSADQVKTQIDVATTLTAGANANANASAAVVASANANVVATATAPAALTLQQSEAQREQAVVQLQAANVAATSQTAAASQTALNQMIATLGTTHPTDPMQSALLNQLMAQNQLNQDKDKQGAAQLAWQTDANTVTQLEGKLAKTPNDNSLKIQLQRAQTAKTNDQALIDAAGKNISSAQTGLASATAVVKTQSVTASLIARDGGNLTPAQIAAGSTQLANSLPVGATAAAANAAASSTAPTTNGTPSQAGRLGTAEQIANAPSAPSNANPSSAGSSELASLQAALAQDQGMVSTAKNNGNPNLATQMQPTIDALNAKIAALQSGAATPSGAPANGSDLTPATTTTIAALPPAPVATLSDLQKAQVAVAVDQDAIVKATIQLNLLDPNSKTDKPKISALNAQITALSATQKADATALTKAQTAAAPPPPAAPSGPPPVVVGIPPNLAALQAVQSQAAGNIVQGQINVANTTSWLKANPNAAPATIASMQASLVTFQTKLAADTVTLSASVAAVPITVSDAAQISPSQVAQAQAQAAAATARGDALGAATATVSALIATQQLQALNAGTAKLYAPTDAPGNAPTVGTQLQSAVASLQALVKSDPSHAATYQAQIAGYNNLIAKGYGSPAGPKPTAPTIASTAPTTVTVAPTLSPPTKIGLSAPAAKTLAAPVKSTSTTTAPSKTVAIGPKPTTAVAAAPKVTTPPPVQKHMVCTGPAGKQLCMLQ